MILLVRASTRRILFYMQIKHLFDNRWAVYDGSLIVAEFDVVENRINGTTTVYWKYGEDQLPIEIINKANETEYYEE